MYWQPLLPNEKVGAILSGYIILFVCALTSVAIYHLGKLWHSPKIGLQAAILYSNVKVCMGRYFLLGIFVSAFK
jgi:hypothetical protein